MWEEGGNQDDPPETGIRSSVGRGSPTTTGCTLRQACKGTVDRTCRLIARHTVMDGSRIPPRRTCFVTTSTRHQHWHNHKPTLFSEVVWGGSVEAEAPSGSKGFHEARGVVHGWLYLMKAAAPPLISPASCWACAIWQCLPADRTLLAR